jgi:hypothetical protein
MAILYRPLMAATMLLSAVSFGIILKDAERDSYHWLGLAGCATVALTLCSRLLTKGRAARS